MKIKQISYGIENIESFPRGLVFPSTVTSDEKPLHARPQRIRTLLHCFLKKLMKTNSAKNSRNFEMHKLQKRRDEKTNVIRKITSSLSAVDGGGGCIGTTVGRHCTPKYKFAKLGNGFASL